jgi:hypothetical protein
MVVSPTGVTVMRITYQTDHDGRKGAWGDFDDFRELEKQDNYRDHAGKDLVAWLVVLLVTASTTWRAMG